MFGNSKGFTLIEVMITVGIAGIVALALTQMNVYTLRGENSVRLSNEFNNLTNLVSFSMQNAPTCNANFGGMTFDTQSLSGLTVPVAALKFPGGNTIVSNGAAYVPGLTISKLQLTSFQALVPGSSYIAMLYIEGTKSPGAYIGSALVSSQIPVALQTNTASGTSVKVTACGSSSGMSMGVTGTLPNGVGYCLNQYPTGTWAIMPGGFIGKNRTCLAYVQSFAKTYRYNSAGCFYDPTNGWIWGCSGDNTVRCGWFCVN